MAKAIVNKIAFSHNSATQTKQDISDEVVDLDKHIERLVNILNGLSKKINLLKYKQIDCKIESAFKKLE